MEILIERIDKIDEGGADQTSACDESTDIEVGPAGEASYPKDNRPTSKPPAPQQGEENRAQEPTEVWKAKFNDPRQPGRCTNPRAPAEARPWAVLAARSRRRGTDKGAAEAGARHAAGRYVVPTRLNATAPVAWIDVVNPETGERGQCETLCDTGAMINLATAEAMKRLGCTIADASRRSDRPRLTMADAPGHGQPASQSYFSSWRQASSYSWKCGSCQPARMTSSSEPQQWSTSTA
jgi:hypothetical protein